MHPPYRPRKVNINTGWVAFHRRLRRDHPWRRPHALQLRWHPWRFGIGVTLDVRYPQSRGHFFAVLRRCYYRRWIGFGSRLGRHA